MNHRITPTRIEALFAAIFARMKCSEFTSGSLLKTAHTDATIMAAIEALMGKRRLHAIRLGKLLQQLREQEVHGAWKVDAVRCGHAETWTYSVSPTEGLPVQGVVDGLWASREAEDDRIEGELEKCSTLEQETKVIGRELARIERQEKRTAREDAHAEERVIGAEARAERREKERVEAAARIAATPIFARIAQRWASRELAEAAGQRLGPDAVVEITRDRDGVGRWSIAFRLDRDTAPRRHAELARMATRHGWRLEPLEQATPELEADVIAFPSSGAAIHLRDASDPFSEF